jgi:hypothetical protein
MLYHLILGMKVRTAEDVIAPDYQRVMVNAIALCYETDYNRAIEAYPKWLYFAIASNFVCASIFGRKVYAIPDYQYML